MCTIKVVDLAQLQVAEWEENLVCGMLCDLVFCVGHSHITHHISHVTYHITFPTTCITADVQRAGNVAPFLTFPNARDLSEAVPAIQPGVYVCAYGTQRSYIVMLGHA